MFGGDTSMSSFRCCSGTVSKGLRSETEKGTNKMGIGFDLTGIFGGEADRAVEFYADARSWQSRIRLLAGRRLSAVYCWDASRDDGKRKDDTKGGGGDGRSV